MEFQRAVKVDNGTEKEWRFLQYIRANAGQRPRTSGASIGRDE